MTVTEPWTVLKLLDWTKGYFARAGLASPRLCAERLLSHHLRCRRVDLYARYDFVPAGDSLDAFRDSVQKAAGGEPVAYLVGRKEFYSLSFTITPDVLIPRPETELLVDQAVAHLRRIEGEPTGWDVCTGSGCVAIAVAKHAPKARVLATDRSHRAVEIATENVRRHDLTGRVTCAVADLLTLPAEWTGEGRFDVLTANPPYVADGDDVGPGVDREPPGALRAGPDGLAVLRPLIAAAPDALKPGGLLCVEFGADQANAIRDLLVAGAFAEPTILRDAQAIERVAVAKRTP